MKKFFAASIFVLILMLALAGCANQGAQQQPASPSTTAPANGEVAPVPPSVPSTPPAETSPAPNAGTVKGVTLTPKSYKTSDFTNFFAKAKEAGTIVAWAGDWNALEVSDSSGPNVVAELSGTYAYTPLIEAQFFTPSTGKLLRPLDTAAKEKYTRDAAAFAEKYKPAYLAFGIEVNTLYEKLPADFDAFADFFSEVYDAVKEKSPSTKVFTIFQLEKMKGLNGGLFGGVNNESKARWALLDKFPKSDIIAFTTYPGLIYKSPSEIPADYYSELSSRTSKPIAFTEIGWHSASSPAGWESSETEQAEFVRLFFERTSSIKPEFAVWSFLYDQPAQQPFDSMGLFNADGSAKQAWDSWLKAA